ncbi:hypothetical protein POTOM_011831 [Populus tomentosa]|uniref:t-SNARE coiled-coil homology domain-containing protein n=1 Tax=Populus tomentosa TaxID=118781 RepID=A0A8X8A620_POPTO|nr:hypothetical protein POTOM_011831 [Populus tomentosa]
MDPLSSISEELAEINGQIADIFRALSNGFQKLEKIKDVNRQSRQLEELTGRLRECKRLIKEFDREMKDMESRNDPDTNKMLNEKKQSMIKELNSYVALKKQYATNLENNKRVDLFDGPNEELHDDNVLLASLHPSTLDCNGNALLIIHLVIAFCGYDVELDWICQRFIFKVVAMTNQQLVDHGNQMMDETDQAIERGKKYSSLIPMNWLLSEAVQPASLPDRVFLGIAFEIRMVKAVVQETINVGTETAAALKAQTEQMSRIVNELDSIHFSIKKASQMVKEIGRQVATDKCIMALLFLIVVGVIAIIIVKLVNPSNKDIRDIPGLAPPAPSRRLLWNPNQETI